MAFITEPTGYYKTALSDLQGAWGNLRQSVVENFGFPDSDKLLFHIDEAMSWESVRNLKSMKETFLLVQNISNQSKAPDDIIEMIDMVRESLDDIFPTLVFNNGLFTGFDYVAQAGTNGSLVDFFAEDADFNGSGGLFGTWDTDGASITPKVVPLPAAFWLFGSGLIGLIGLRHRSKQTTAIA